MTFNKAERKIGITKIPSKWSNLDYQALIRKRRRKTLIIASAHGKPCLN